jgi:hypothetical protein
MRGIVKIKLIVAMLFICGLSACSMLPGGGGDEETRVVDDEEIAVGKVYISKGRIHCEDQTGKTLAETRADLEAAGIKVFSSACGVITGKMAPALCGGITLHINVHEIDQSKFPEAQTLGYEPIAGLADGQGYESGDCD